MRIATTRLNRRSYDDRLRSQSQLVLRLSISLSRAQCRKRNLLCSLTLSLNTVSSCRASSTRFLRQVVASVANARRLPTRKSWRLAITIVRRNLSIARASNRPRVTVDYVTASSSRNSSKNQCKSNHQLKSIKRARKYRIRLISRFRGQSRSRGEVFRIWTKRLIAFSHRWRMTCTNRTRVTNLRLWSI